jgi:hypothetical protein
MAAGFAASLLALGAARTANAAFITIDDTAPNETVTVSVGDFEFGATVNGLSTGGVGHSLTTTVAETAPITFSGSWIDLGGSTPGTFAQIAFDAGGVLSDELVYSVSTTGFAGTIFGSFCSDPTVCSIPVGAIVTVVGEGPNAFNQSFLSASWVSDVDVPEPATLALFGVGLLGIGLIRRTRA